MVLPEGLYIYLLTRAGYNERVKFGMFLINSGDCRSGFMAGTSTAYKWVKKYHLVTVGEESQVLVLCPKENQQKKKKRRGIGVIDVTSMRLEDLQQPTYAKKLFAELWKIHQVDHCKGNTLFTYARDCHGNIRCEVCKIFTDVCPQCVKVLSRRKPVAGIKNIVTEGFEQIFLGTMNKLHSTCRVAVKQGILKPAYAYHVLKPVPEASKNLDAMNLRLLEAYEGWRSLPRVTEREIARYILSVKGQGIIHCNCRGTCTTNTCLCKKAGRLCSLHCHRNSKTCKNMHKK